MRAATVTGADFVAEGGSHGLESMIQARDGVWTDRFAGDDEPARTCRAGSPACRRGRAAWKGEREADGGAGGRQAREPGVQGRDPASEGPAAAAADEAVRDGDGDGASGAGGGERGGAFAAASSRPRRVEAEHRPHGDAEGVGAGGIAPQGLRGDRRSGHRVQARGHALQARTLDDAGRADGGGGPSGGRRGRLSARSCIGWS